MSNAKQTSRVTPGSSETLLTMLEALPDALFFVDDADTIVYANASAQTITGAPPEEYLGHPFWRCAPQLVSTSLYQAVLKSRQTREPTAVEYVSPVTQRWLHVHLSPTVGGLMVQFHEVREPARCQEMFPQCERLSIDDLDGLHTRIGVLTPEGIILEINGVPLDDAHVRREEVIGKLLIETPWWSFFPASQERLRAAIAQASRGETVRFEAVVCPREGMVLHFEVAITPHMDTDHHIEYLVIAGIDITARKRADEAIHTLIEAIPQLVWIARPDGSVTYHNQRLIDYLAMTLEQVEGAGWLAGVHPDDRQRVWDVWRTSIQTGEPYAVEHRVQDGTSGAYCWFLARGVPQRNAQGTILHWVGTCTDIDEQKRAEQQLKESEQNWRALAETVPQLVWTTSPDGQHEYANQHWGDYMGLTVEHMQSDRWAPLPFIHPDDREGTRALWLRALDTGEMYEHEERFRNSQIGAYRWFLARAMPVRDETGQIVKWFGTCTDIEDQKQAEQKIKASEQNWRVLAETVPQFVWIGQPGGLKEYYNQRWFDYAHATFEQLQGDGWLQFLHPDDYERTQALGRHASETGEPYEIENRFKDGKTGSYRWFLTRGMPMRDETGQIVKWFGTCTDIHEKKQAEDDIRALVDTIPQLVFIAGPDGLITYNNQRLIDYQAMTLEQVEGDGWMATVHPDDLQRVRETLQTSIQTGVPYEVEHRMQDGTSGAYRWFLVRCVPQRNAQGTILQWIGTCTDIDEQKQAEERIKASEQNLRVLAETVPQLVWTARPDGRLDYVNQRYCDFVQTDGEHLLDYGWRQFLHPDDYQHALTVWRRVLATGEPYETEHRFKDGKTGSYRWFLVRAMPVRDETGQLVKWFGTCTDIEEQKRIEEALRQSQERASALMNSSIIGINISEGEQIVDTNDTFLRMTGYTREDLREGRMNWMHMTPPDYLARTLQAYQELATQQSMTPYEKEYVCKDGSRLPVIVGRVTLQANPSQGIAFVLDNSARKELEQRKDDFISMASHELKTPLTAVKMQAQLVRRRLERQGLHEAAAALLRVEEPVNLLERLTAELLDVSKIQAGRLEYAQEPVDLDALLWEITDTMQQINPSHTIVVRGAVQASLLGDRDRLGQVFTNLLSNAIKYSPDAKTVEIDLDASPETVTIRVHDHGLGIPREQRDKVFERFYRAAGSRHKAVPGLGMGLYIVAEIVKRHGGTITVDSAVGEGSTFTVTLPLNRDI